MTHKIISTGPFKGHPGACTAQFNHKIHPHMLNQHLQHSPNYQPHQQQISTNGHNGFQTERPPGTLPYYY